MVVVFAGAVASLSLSEGRNSFAFAPMADAGGDAVSYSLDAAGMGMFTIGADGTVVLKQGSVFDYEDANLPDHLFTFNVIATDTVDNTTALQQVQLRVLNLLDEAGEAVFTMAATDDNGNTISYGLNSGLFRLDSPSGHVVVLKQNINDVNRNSWYHDVPLTIYNPSGPATVQKLSFYIPNAPSNDLVVWRNLPIYTYSLSEDTTQVVQQLSANDQSGHAITSYSLSGSDSNYFTIDGNNQLLLLSTADYENPNHVPLYSVTVIAYASNGVTGQEQVRVALQMALSGTPVVTKQYNETNQTDGIYTARVLDNGNATIKYALFDPNGYVTINSSSGAIGFKKTFNLSTFSMPALGDITPFVTPDKQVINSLPQIASLSLNDLSTKRLVVNDNPTLVASLNQKFNTPPAASSNKPYQKPNELLYTVVIYASTTQRGATTYATQLLVLDISKSPNSDLINWTGNNAADASQVVVLDYRHVDNNLLQFSAVATDRNGRLWYGLNDNNFAVNVQTGQVSLKDGVRLADGQQYSFVVTAIAGRAGPEVSVSKLVVVIGGVGVNETNANYVVLEDSAPNLRVVNFTPTDGGRFDNVALVAGGVDNDYFKIVGNELQFVSSIDYETLGGHAPFYTVSVKFNETIAGQALSAVKTYIVSLGNMDDNAPVFDQKIHQANVQASNNRIGQSIGLFHAYDPDGQAVSYSLSGTDAVNFSITADGNLAIASTLNFINHPVYSVVVVANSRGNGSGIWRTGGTAATAVTQLVTIFGGLAVNETNANYLVLEDSATNLRVVDFEPADRGSFDSIVLVSGGADNSYFKIVGNQLQFVSSIDYENRGNHDPMYTVSVKFTETIAGQELSAVKTYIVSLGNLDQHDVVFNQSSTGMPLTEGNLAGVTLANFTATDPDGQSVSYNLAGADAGFFTINSDGAVMLKSSLDAESGHGALYTVIVQGHSYGGKVLPYSATGALLITQLFVLSLGNINDNAPVFTSSFSSFSINENNPRLFSLADFEAIDADGQSISYSLDDVAGSDTKKYFAIDSATGVLRLRSMIDSESTDHPSPFYTIVVRANSFGNGNGLWVGGGTAATAISQVYILSLFNLQDNAVSFTNVVGDILIGNSDNVDGQTIGNFNAVDLDGQMVSYNLTGADASSFEIDSNGQLKLIVGLDFNAKPTYSVVVNAHSFGSLRGPAADAGNATAISQLVTISGTRYVNEGDTAVGVFNGVRLDSNADDSVFFNFNSSTGELSLIDGLPDYDRTTKHLYTAVIITNASSHLTQTVIIAIRHLKNEDIFFNSELPGVAITEGMTQNLILATFNASDPDGMSVSYDLAGADAGNFLINSQGHLKLKVTTDYETKQLYTVIVQGHSYGGNVYAYSQTGALLVTEVFVLSINNINDNPTAWSGAQSTSVMADEKNATGATVATFTTTDADGAGASYWLTGTDSNLFTIDSNGNLQLVSSLDYEGTYNGHDGHSFTITVNARGTAGVNPTGNGLTSIAQNFVLSLSNSNDAATMWLGTQPTGLGVSENNATNINVATFATTDIDGPGASYWLTGTDSNLFTINSNGNLQLLSSLNYEGTYNGHDGHSFTITVNARGTAAGNPTGDGLTSIVQDFVLSLGNVNDSLTAWSGVQSTGVMADENNAINVNVATFTTTDMDGAGASYWLTGADKDLFTIDGNGNLQLVSSLNYEGNYNGHDGHLFTITVNAIGTAGADPSGDGLTPIMQDFVLSLGNVNDSLTAWLGVQTTSLAADENNATGAAIATFTTTDVDGAGASYWLTGTDSNLFTIDSNGNLKFASMVDYEGTYNGHDGHSFTIKVNAIGTAGANPTSDGLTSIVQDFVLSINNVNDSLTAWSGVQSTGVMADENNATNVNVATFTTTDVDGAGASYWLTGTDKDLFTIDGNGNLKLASMLDYEGNYNGHDGHLFTITVNTIGTAGANPSGDGLTSIVQNFVLSLGNLNDSATMWSGTPSTDLVLSENNATGAAIATFTTTDVDGAGASYWLTGTDKDLFTIDSNGNLQLLSSLDYEGSYNGHDGHSFTITVNAVGTAGISPSGDGLAAITQNFILSVANANDSLTAWSGQQVKGMEIAEKNRIGLSVTQFITTDADGAGASYWLTGVDSDFFSIDNNGQLTVISRLNYDDTYHGHRGDYFTITINAIGTAGVNPSGDGLTAITQNFILSLTNSPPLFGNIPSAEQISLVEGQTTANKILFSFQGYDSDGIEIPVSYSLSNQFDRGKFNLSSDGILRITDDIDWDAKPTYSVVVNMFKTMPTTGRGARNTASILYVLSVGNIDDNGTSFTATTGGVSLNELNQAGVSIANFAATDLDGQMISYSLSGVDAAWFSLDANTGRLLALSSFNYENGHGELYSITITANSYGRGGGLWLAGGRAATNVTQNFVLSLFNFDAQAPTFAQVATGLSLNEGNSVGLSVGQFSAIDLDGQTIQYNLGGSDARFFNIDSNGVLTLNQSLNFQNRHGALYSVVVLANSIGQPTGNWSLAGTAATVVSQLYILSLFNLDINAPSFTQTTSGIVLAEGNLVNQQLFHFAAIDVDGQQVSYSLSGNGTTYGVQIGNFLLDARAGDLTFSGATDFENQKYYTVVVNAHSHGNITGPAARDGVTATAVVSQLFIFSIGNIDDNAPSFTQAYSFVAVAEGNVVNTNLLQFAATDMDGQKISYSLGDVAGGNDKLYFSIDANTGVLKITSSLDYESSTHAAYNYSIVVFANSYGPLTGASFSTGSAQNVISQLFVLSLQNINDNNVNFSTIIQGVSVNENNAVGLSIANFAATDADNQNISFHLMGDDSVYFSIDSASGNVVMVSSLDYESGHRPLYSLVVYARSYGNVVPGGNAIDDVSQLMVLSLYNIDEFSPVFVNAQAILTLGTLNLSENNQLGIRMADFRATDYDANQTISYYIGGGSMATFAATDPGSGAVNYQITNDADYFTIDQSTGVVYFKSALDADNPANRARNGRYHIVVYASDSTSGLVVGTPPVSTAVSQTFDLQLANIVDLDSTPDVGLVVSETNALGIATVAVFSSYDYANSLISYAFDSNIVGSNPFNYFNIDARTGVLSFNTTLDFEKLAGPIVNNVHLYTVAVRAYSSTITPLNVGQTFILSVQNVDEFSTGFTQKSSGLSLAETKAANTILATFSASDGDGQAISYIISGADANYFSINQTSGASTASGPNVANGRLIFTSSLNYDVPHGKFYTITVTARADVSGGVVTKSGVLFDITQVYVLTIGNVNDSRPSFSQSPSKNVQIGGVPTIALSETKGLGTSLFTYQAVDSDKDANISYSIADTVTGGVVNVQRDVNYFSINSQTGNLIFLSALSYEPTRSLFSIVVKVSSYDNVVTPAGAYNETITQLVVVKIDNAELSLHFASGTATNFVDYNNTPIGLSVLENANSARNLAILKPFTLFNYNDANGNPHFTNISYSLIGSNSYMTIDQNTGQLYFLPGFHYANAGKSIFPTQIKVTANNIITNFGVTQLETQSVLANFTLSLFNFNANNPVFTPDPNVINPGYNVNSVRMDENIQHQLNNFPAPYYVNVGTFVAVDDDDQAIVYSIDSVTPGTTPLAYSNQYFNIVNLASLTVNNHAGFILQINNAPGIPPVIEDYQLNRNFTVVVRATSTGVGGGLWLGMTALGVVDYVTQTIVINLNNVDQYSTAFRNNMPEVGRATIVESNALPPALFTFQAADADFQVVSYYLTGADAQYFNIAFTNNPNGDGQFYANDVGNGVSNILLKNDGTTQLNPINERSISHNYFNGILSFISTPDFDNLRSHQTVSGLEFFTVTVVATTAGDNQIVRKNLPGLSNNNFPSGYYTPFTSATKTFILTLQQTDKYAPAFAAAPVSMSLNEDDSVNKIVTTFTANDRDGQVVSYSLLGADAYYFSINANTGVLTMKNADYDYDIKQGNTGHNGIYQITVRAKSTLGNLAAGAITAVDTNFTLNLFNLDDENPAFKNPVSGLGMTENNGLSVVPLATFAAIDPDGQPNITYSLGNNPNNYFSIDSGTGKLLFASVLDFENLKNAGGTAASGNLVLYTIIIKANSLNGAGIANFANGGTVADVITTSFVLSIQNIDDNAPVFISPVPSLYVDNAIGLTGVNTFAAIDADGQTISYVLVSASNSTTPSIDDRSRFILDSRTGVLKFKSTNDMNLVSGYGSVYGPETFVIRAVSGAFNGASPLANLMSVTATTSFYFYTAHDITTNGQSNNGNKGIATNYTDFSIDVFNIKTREFASVGGVDDAFNFYSLGNDGIKFDNSAFGVGQAFNNFAASSQLVVNNLVNLLDIGEEHFNNIKAYLFANGQKDTIITSISELNAMVGTGTGFSGYFDKYDRVYLTDAGSAATDTLSLSISAALTTYLLTNQSIINGNTAASPTNGLQILDDQQVDVYNINSALTSSYYEAVTNSSGVTIKLYGYDNKQDVIHFKKMAGQLDNGTKVLLNSLSALQTYMVGSQGTSAHGDGKVELMETSLTDASNNPFKQYAIKFGLVNNIGGYNSYIYLSNQDMSTGTAVDLTTGYNTIMGTRAGTDYLVDPSNSNIHYHDLSFNEFLTLIGGSHHLAFT
ncbi:MAG: cadherin repeat domain-containing protein [Hydrotalea sp.]|nr:cadherin repeat domain-containing protein [Hydrotalea sp.]